MKSIVFLDLGDTLIEINPKAYAKWARAISSVSRSTIAVDDLRQAIKDEWASRNGEPLEWVNTEETEQQYWRAFYRAVLKRLSVPNPPQELLDLLAQGAADPKSFVCFDDIEVLGVLREKGVRLGLISSAFPSAKRILDHLHPSEWFDPLSLSCDLAWAKPDPRIYKHALECAHITPEQSLFVDDRLTFVKGAQKVDMDALLIDRENSCQVEPGMKICGLGQLLTAVPIEQECGMQHSLRVYKVFVASPSDVDPERKSVFRVIEEINHIYESQNKDYRLELWAWEGVHPDLGPPQEVIKKQIPIEQW